jgi:hypothetical protein
MDRTRRSLCGIGLASVPLAMVAPKLLPAAQERAAGAAADPLLAYLAAETRRHCRAALRPGARRSIPLRGLAANVGMLTVYVQSRLPIAEIEASLRTRLREGGGGALMQKTRDEWPVHAARMGKELGLRVPKALDEAALSQAVENIERYGCPRLGGVRRLLESEADRVERAEGRGLTTTSIRQTPGSDYGPPGWAAGAGDPGFTLSCYELAVLIAALAIVLAYEAGLASAFGQVVAVLNLLVTIACAD